MKKHTKNFDGGIFEIELPNNLNALLDEKMISPEEVNEWLDIQNRRLYINFEIGQSLVDYVGYYITKWNQEDEKAGLEPTDRQAIKIYINTPGGDVFSAIHVCDLIEASNTPITTIAQSWLYSAGLPLFISGHHRVMYKNSSALIHEGSFMIGGSAGKAKDTAKFYEQLDERIFQIIKSKTNITEDMLKEKEREEWYFFADEALELGVCDEIAKKVY